MKPLYLHSRTPVHVDLDGPALLVRAEGTADRRYPLCRISRVIANDASRWTTRALLACADESIAVGFLRSDGVVRARWIGCPGERDRFVQLWTDFLDRPDWEQRYGQWREASRRRAIRFCAMRMGWRPASDPRSPFEAIRDTTPNPPALPQLHVLKRRLYGLSQCRASSELHRLGVPDAASETLLSAFVPAIQWGIHPELCTWLARKGQDGYWQKNPEHYAATFFERHTATVDFVVQDTLARLVRYLREWS